MALWQVDFALAPRRALANAAAELRNEAVLDVDWWGDSALPKNYVARIEAFAAPGKPWADDVQTWGAEDGDRIDIWSDDGAPRQVLVRFDVRRLDAKFAAGVLGFSKAAGAVLIRDDGWVIEPTVNGLSTALKSSNAWRLTQAPSASPGALDEADED